MDANLDELNIVQPGVTFVSNGRSSIINNANIQGSPDLVMGEFRYSD
jgi:hypothetical protein